MTTTETTTTTVRVTIVGPNLPNELTRKGEFHVHAAGCADLKRGAIGRAMRSPDSHGWEILVTDRLGVEADVYDFAPDEVEGYTLGDFQGEFHFAPCLDHLPLDSNPEPEAAPVVAPVSPDQREHLVAGLMRQVAEVIDPANMSRDDAIALLESLSADLTVELDALSIARTMETARTISAPERLALMDAEERHYALHDGWV